MHLSYRSVQNSTYKNKSIEDSSIIDIGYGSAHNKPNDPLTMGCHHKQKNISFMYQPQTFILKYCMTMKSISRGLRLTTHTYLVFIIEIQVETGALFS
jgi:hypothetical protein